MKLRAIALIMALQCLAGGGVAGAARADCTLLRYAELPVTMVGLRPTVPITINGHEAQIIADSGAFFSSLSADSAAKFGLTKGAMPFGLEIRGVTGEAKVSLATAKTVIIDKMPHKNVDFLIDDGGSPEPGVVGLLGQNMIGVADTEFDLANGIIRLFTAKDCGKAGFAYWTTTQPYSVIDIVPTTPPAPHVKAWANLNGVRIRVELDTGSPTSTLTLAAAARAGVKRGGVGVVSGGRMSGFGSDSELDTWIGPFDSFKLGDEEIKRTRLRFSDIKLEGDADMLLGADFFLSHRIYVSHGQHKLYFTYNGGPVFDLTVEPASASAPAPARPPDGDSAANTYSDMPTDAAGYARRGAAFAARQDVAHAMADLGKAIAMDPKEPRYVYQRARLELAHGPADAAMADLDQTLKLKPDNVEARIARARLHLANGEKDASRQDLVAADGYSKDDVDMYLAIAVIEGESGFYREAMVPLDRWIDSHPRDGGRAEVLNMRCWYRALWGVEAEKALADCDAALKLKPGWPAYLDSRGLARVRLGDYDQAIADYTAALRRPPKQAWSLYGRGLAELKSGRKAEGEADIKAATAIDADLPGAAKALGLAP
jgi:tetratricopeptide (TPR) repeat protein